jgi:hypothetical protein
VAFYDFYIKNVKLNYDGVEKLRICCTIQRGVRRRIFFNAYFVDIGGLEGYYGHFEYDAKKQNIKMMEVFRN